MPVEEDDDLEAVAKARAVLPVVAASPEENALAGLAACSHGPW